MKTEKLSVNKVCIAICVFLLLLSASMSLFLYFLTKNTLALYWIDRLKGQKIASYEKYREGILSKEEFLCTKCDFTNELHEMYNKLDIICKKTQQVEEETSQKRQLLEMKDMAGTLQEVDQKVIDLFVKKVEIYANRRIKIQWNFSDLFGN